MSAPVLETERLRLRLVEERDLDCQCELLADPLSISVYGQSFPRADVWRRMAMKAGHWQLRGFGPWVLEHKSSGSFVGNCDLWFPESWDDIEIGWSIHPKFRGQGLAAEAAIRVRQYGYVERGFKRLVSYINPTNTNSIRVATKLGAVPDGTFDMAGIAHIIYLHPKSSH